MNARLHGSYSFIVPPTHTSSESLQPTMISRQAENQHLSSQVELKYQITDDPPFFHWWS